MRRPQSKIACAGPCCLDTATRWIRAARPQAALPRWARQPAIAITRALCKPPPQTFHAGMPESLAPAPSSLVVRAPTPVALSVSTARGFNLDLVYTVCHVPGPCFLLPTVLFTSLPPALLPENASGPPPSSCRCVAMSTEVSQSLAAAMARPQIGIDRLPARRVSNEPREAMNCKSCRKRKVILLAPRRARPALCHY